MNRLKFVLDSRGLKNSIARARQVGERFGITSARMEGRLAAYADIVGDYGANPSLPITAVVLDRNPHVADDLAGRGVELCVHGFVHNDLSKLPAEVQRHQIARAVSTFTKHGIDFTGFRSPYLRYDTATLEAVEDAGFEYDSNLAFYWQPQDSLQDLAKAESDGLRRGLRFYDPVSYPADRSLPRFYGRLIEIPVSLPDDEILLDRMGWAPPRIGGAWVEMAGMALARMELLTIQLHPERTGLLEGSLRSVLEFARSSGGFWITTMGEIAAWWRRRTDLELEVTASGAGKFVVPSPCRPATGLYLITPRTGARRPVGAGEAIAAPRRPLVGIDPGADANLIHKIRDMGYCIEKSDDTVGYAVHFDAACHADDIDRALADLDHPVLADGLWPAPFKAAMAVTGDIDCLTLGDFIRRFTEG